MVSKDKADRDGLKVGSTLTALFGPPNTLTVQGIYDDKDLAGNLMVNRAALRRLQHRPVRLRRLHHQRPGGVRR